MPITVKAKPHLTCQAQSLQGEPCVVVIFGVLGDLAKRKLLPSLFNLFNAGALAGCFKVLGIGRDQLNDDQFHELMRDAVKIAKETNNFNPELFQQFAQSLHYQSGDLSNQDTYHQVAATLEKLAKTEGAGRNHLYYLSTPPELASTIITGLSSAGLTSEEQGWSRIVVEKPFGRDLKSARELNSLIAQHFAEHQVYRIDHYLGKETVQNIVVFRFGNSLFEPIWNRSFVDYVEITAAETLGVGSRAGYYEQAGALRDMVANHMLQLLALTAMEPPVTFDADWIRNEKIRVWRAIQPMTPDQVVKYTVRGQYHAGQLDGKKLPSYRDEPGVGKHSMIETYVALELHIDNWRWSGVPFYLRTGKALAGSLTEIAVHLKQPPQTLFNNYEHDKIEPNVIVLRIQPSEGISATLVAKHPGAEMSTSTVHMDFCYQDAFDVRLPAAYETLLLSVMRGDTMLFERQDGIEAQWRLITPIEEAWAALPSDNLPTYPAGSEGPEAANQLLQRKGHHWRSIGHNQSGCLEKTSAPEKTKAKSQGR